MNVLRRPDFTTTVGTNYDEWVTENDDSLREWYRLTNEWAPEEHVADFLQFAAVQFDLAAEDDARLRDGLYEVMLAESDAEDSPNEEAP